MEMNFSEKRIEFDKELNALDEFVIEFTSILNKLNIRYVIVSGYVAVLFGRNRISEDVDMIIEKVSFNKFKKFWNEVNKEFECINTRNMNEAYNEFLCTNHAIRFSRKDAMIPNVEVKFPKTEFDLVALKNKKELILNNNKFFISPLELQIAFKLFLGSEKDIEDARFLYKLFKDKIDLEELKRFNRKLKIEELFNKYLR